MFTHVGQWGTHVDPPAHFVNGMRTVDQIELKEMVFRWWSSMFTRRRLSNPDYTLTVERIGQWEKAPWRYPGGCVRGHADGLVKAVAGRRSKLENKDSKGVAHYPGWSLPALKMLYEERKITASGHETTDTDPGLATTKDDYSLETYILKTNHYQIELLTNLDQVPESGAIVIATFPKPKGGSGFPARVFAIVP